LRLGIIWILLFDVPPDVISFGHDTAKIGDDKLVLRFEMPIQRHLVGAGGLGNRIDADAAKSMAMEQIARCGENPRAGRRDHRKFVGHACFLQWTVSHDPLDRDVTDR
jgi:hypothetical protein